MASAATPSATDTATATVMAPAKAAPRGRTDSPAAPIPPGPRPPPGGPSWPSSRGIPRGMRMDGPACPILTIGSPGAPARHPIIPRGGQLLPLTRLLCALLVPGRAGLPGRADDPPQANRDVIALKRCEVDYVRSSQVGVASMGLGASILQDCY